MANGFFGRLGPVLQGAGASLASTGDLSAIGTTIPRFQAIQQREQALAGQQQLRDLQTQAAQQRLADAERERQQEAATAEAFRALPPGIFGGGDRGAAIRAAGVANPALGQKLLVQASKPPAQMTPFEAGRLKIAQATERRKAAAAEEQSERDAAFAQLFGGGQQPTAAQPATLDVSPTARQPVALAAPQAARNRGILKGLTPEQVQSVGVLASDRGTRADAVKMATKFRAENRKLAEAEKKTRLAEEQKLGQTGIVVQDLDRGLGILDRNADRVTGATGQLLSNIGGTDARNLFELLQTIQANISFDKLNAMRQASKTGGALGSITPRELELLAATAGSLNQSQDAKQLRFNMIRLKNQFLDTVHGPGQGPPRQAPDAPKGVTEEDIRFTMQKHGLSREEVLANMGAQ